MCIGQSGFRCPGIELRLHLGKVALRLHLFADVEAGIRSGMITGGMIPKLQNIVDLLRRGVKSAHIINGNTRNSLLAEVFTDEGTGTMVSAV